MLLNKVKEYKPLGSYVEEVRELDREVERKAQVGGGKWREASGILYNKRVR